MLSAINGLSGVASVELLPQKDGDASVYLIEADAGVDIRKNLFYEMANKKFPIVGLENSGMNLEDIFIAVVDQTSEVKARYERPSDKKVSKRRADVEKDLASDIVKTTEKKQGGEFSALFGDDDDDK